MSDGASQVVLVVKKPPVNARDAGSIPGSGRSPRGGYVNPFQYSCLENLMNRGTSWVYSTRVAKESEMTEVT